MQKGMVDERNKMNPPEIIDERAAEVIQACNAYLKAILSGDEKAMEKAFRDWEKLLVCVKNDL
jgi:hypothetical protein